MKPAPGSPTSITSVELRPDCVKVDASLVRGVDNDVNRQAVVAGILHFAATAGCQVIAEGIETDTELAILKELGVSLGQGYLLGRRHRPTPGWALERADSTSIRSASATIAGAMVALGSTRGCADRESRSSG